MLPLSDAMLVRSVFQSAAAVLPVSDLRAALDRYRRLGFEISEYEGGGYGYATRDGVQLHLSKYEQLDPGTTTSVLFLYVADAEALYEEWRAAGVDGRLRAPTRTASGMLEGGYVDPDGNLLRLGSSAP